VIVAELAVKLVIEAAGGGGVELDEPPPQPVKPPRTKPRAIAHVANTKDRLMILPVTRKFVIFLAGNDTALSQSRYIDFVALPKPCPGRHRKATAAVVPEILVAADAGHAT
jgi:hypothetical protein